jgi:ribosomal protein L37AE/L43A
MLGGEIKDAVGTWKECISCGDDVHIERWNLGYHHCKRCGDALAKQKRWTVSIPYSKGAYQLVYDPKDLFNTNPKRTT